jgi:DUF4097 and DUF4098 domain-containing protein YvlB
MNKFLLLCVFLFSSGLQAWDCEYEKNIEQELDLAGSDILVILAGAGDLEIAGSDDVSVATIRGHVCVSVEEWLAESRVDVLEGRQAEIIVELPEVTDSWLRFGQSYAYIDLRIVVPEGTRLDVKDSSGDVDIAGVSAIQIKDSSGDISIEDISGPVTLFDSSGDVVLSDIKGDVTVESDSSGDIRGRDIEGSVLVNRDSSGDIRFIDVGQDFTVERDSSGDISAKGVGGNFSVLADGSGDIVATKVNGQVLMPNS